MKIRITNLFLVPLFLFGLINHTAQAAKLYKWVDENGNISYQDSPPPDGSNVVNEKEIRAPKSTSQTPSTPTDPVMVYTVDNCEGCELLLLRLQNWNVPTEQKSLQDREVQARILELSGSLQAPTLFIGDKLISNLASDNLISELNQAGYNISKPATKSAELVPD